MLYGAGTAALWLVIASRGIAAGKPRRRFLERLGTATLVTGAFTTMLYMPVLIASGVKPLVSNNWVQSKSLAYFFANISTSLFGAWRLWTQDVPPAVVAVFTVGFVLALVFQRRIAGRGAWVLSAAILCIVPLVLVQRVVPYARVWLFLLPLCAAVSGAGLWFLVRALGSRGAATVPRLSAAVALCCVLGMCIPDLRGTRLASSATSTNIEYAAVWLN